jgi:hypothetical protein
MDFLATKSSKLPMDDAIASIVAFVEGRIEPAEFEKRLYNDPAIEFALNDDPTLKPCTYIETSTFLFVVQQDFESPGGILNVQGALSQFLERKQIPFRPTGAHSQLYDIILKAQPGWLNVPDDWLKKNVLSAAERRKGKKLRDWLRARLLELFKYRVKPPKWIQCPDWPIGENGPLVFLGQIRIPDYFHDEAAAYLFHDPTTGRCETVIQIY